MTPGMLRATETITDAKTPLIEISCGSAVNRDVLGQFYVQIKNTGSDPLANIYIETELQGGTLGFNRHAAFSDSQLAYIASKLVATTGFVAFTIQLPLYSTVKISGICAAGEEAVLTAEVSSIQGGSQIESVIDGGTAAEIAKSGVSPTPINSHLSVFNLVEEVIPFTEEYGQLMIENTGLHVVYVKCGESNLVNDLGKPLAPCVDDGGAVLGTGGCVVENEWHGDVYIYSASALATCYVSAN